MHFKEDKYEKQKRSSDYYSLSPKITVKEILLILVSHIGNQNSPRQWFISSPHFVFKLTKPNH